MSVRPRSVHLRTVGSRTLRSLRMLPAALVVAVIATGCGNVASIEVPLSTAPAPGQPAGTVQIPAGTDAAQTVQRVQDAILANGGTVAAVVDHAAAARTAGVEIPPTVVVIGGAPTTQVPMIRADQPAGANLPQRYLVRQGVDGTVTLTYDGADYLAAVSRVTAPDVRSVLREANTAVAGQAVPGTTVPQPASLVGVTPSGYLLSVFGSADVPVTVERLRRAADRGGNRTIAAVDLAVGSADPGPGVRPTAVVLVSVPAAEAPLLAAAPSIGLDLPIRFVVWLDDQNRTQIGYPDPRRVAARHGIPVEDPNVVRLVAEADRLARLAAGVIE